MVDKERSLARITPSRRGLFRGVRDIGRATLARPTKGAEVLLQAGQQLAAHPELAEKALDAAKTAFERFQTTPQPFSPDWNFDVVARLNKYLGDPEGLQEFGEALYWTKRDITPAERLLRDLIKEEDGGELELTNLYGASRNFRDYDASVRKWCPAPGDRLTTDSSWGDEWAQVLLKNAETKAIGKVDPMPDILKALDLLRANKYNHPVHVYARADLAYYEAFDRHHPDWLAKVNDGLRNYDPELGFGAHESAFNLFLQGGDFDRARELLPQMEARYRFPASRNMSREELIKIVMESDPNEAAQIAQEGIDSLEGLRDGNRNLDFYVRVETAKLEVAKEIAKVHYDGPEPDVEATLGRFFNLSTLPSTYAKVGKYAVDLAVWNGMDATPLVRQTIARIRKPATGDIFFEHPSTRQDLEYDGPEVLFGNALGDVIDMQLRTGDIRGAHATYRLMAGIHEKTDQFAYELPKNLVKIAKEEANPYRDS